MVSLFLQNACISVCSRLELFDNFMQQDAHEFFNYLLNAVSEALADEKKELANGTIKANGTLKKGSSSIAYSGDPAK